MAKIRKIKIANGAALEIEDEKAIHSINGYTYEDISGETPTITFPNKRITEDEINSLFGGNA